jgi:hypothetical protein
MVGVRLVQYLYMEFVIWDFLFGVLGWKGVCDWSTYWKAVHIVEQLRAL